ncbi:hypothetical protein JR316_0012975 [Psilocybe cubensis]|uniref:Uncharacterized protein n=1 Tax=Psilocybe cubensis TaxID=181762 RepID=A0ACB8GHH2_PSICU|nr:hypothetical protein JR316_0012975 [Psilocybe cubensis]KAH9474514.1 hypothetical protein JR316_0012975 [Psilocybe cubensis]
MPLLMSLCRKGAALFWIIALLTQNRPSVVAIDKQRNPFFTPRKAATAGGTSKVTQLRTVMAYEMEGEFITCGIDDFMSHYFAFVPDTNNVTRCIQRHLIPSGVAYIDKSKLVLSEFPDTPTIDKAVPGKKNEMEVFAPLVNIANNIGKYVYQHQPGLAGPTPIRNKFKYRNVPYSSISSDILGSNHKVDACFTSDHDNFLSTWGTAVSIEQKVKVNNEQRLDNMEKVLSANVQVMNDDVRRMFTYGDPERLIKIFMFFLFATEEQLGYDPLVERQVDGQYIFRIRHSNPNSNDADDSRFYRTVKVLSGYRSNNITGRMPRVWTVERYNPTTGKAMPGSLQVLKDVWIDHNAQTERQIQEAIFEAINKFGDQEAPEHPDLKIIWAQRRELIQSRDYQRLFLTIEDDYDGRQSKVIAPGSRRIWGLFDPVRTFYQSPGTNSRHDTGHIRPIHTYKKTNIERHYVPKKQYRVVFKEICLPIGSLPTLGDAMDVLQDIHIALQLMYCAGWVHRDISDGNILACKKQGSQSQSSTIWQAKLMDLEYARPFQRPDEAAADPKTGTPFFMPIEILKQEYFYRKGLEQPEDDVDYIASRGRRRAVKAAKNDIVTHNFQHDLESVWWLILYLIVSRVFIQPLEYWEGRILDEGKAERWISSVFQNLLLLSQERKRCFDLDGTIEQQIMGFTPNHLEGLVESLELSQTALMSFYLNRERKEQIYDHASYARAHINFGEFLESVQTLEPKTWRQYVLPLSDPIISTQTDTPADAAPETSAPQPSTHATIPPREYLFRPSKVKAKRGSEENPNRGAGGSNKGAKRSRNGV